MPKTKNKKSITKPIALFDTISNIKKLELNLPKKSDFANDDFNAARIFLNEYNDNQATFNSYRREVERLLQWAWLIQKKSIFQIKRDDVESYVIFCKNPPKAWIGTAKVPRFIDEDGKRKPNSAWRPFVVTISKTETKQGKIPDIKQYSLSEKAIREIFAILGSFYKFLIQEGYTEINPVVQIRQKSKYFRKQQTKTVIRRLTELQWDTVIETAKQLAETNPKKHERTLFIMSILYSMYLRVSELTANKRWLPKMNDFRRDHDGNWWFTTVGKGNKERQIAVSNSMLDALKRWRKYLKLTPLPPIDDQMPLIPNTRSEGAISSTNQIRNIVQYCFDKAIKKLRENRFTEEANGLESATVHWLRHTGISDDIKRRPREHVRDDAGHSSSVTTDKYIDVDLRERHASAKTKFIDRDEAQPRNQQLQSITTFDKKIMVGKKMLKNSKKRNNNLDNLGDALDAMLAGKNIVVGSDFIMTHHDPYNADIGHLDPKDLRTYDQKFVNSLVNFKSQNKIDTPEDLKNLYQEYREHRLQLGDHQVALQKNVFKYDIEASKELGNFDTYISKVVIRNEAEMNIFYDYIALYRALNGKRAIIQWHLDHPKYINKKNQTVVAAYEKSKFTILRLDKNLEHGSIKVTNIITKSECILMDKALNESKKEGCFFLCSILDMGSYIMTSGGGIPIDANSSAGKSALTLFKQYFTKLQESESVFNNDIIECVRIVYGFCLRGGAVQYMTIK